MGVYAFDLAQPLDSDQVGGKAANLARAAALGLPVPGGLVLARQALRSVLDEAGLLGEVTAVMAGYAGQGHGAQTAAYAGLCARVMAAAIPAAVREAVEPAVVALLAQAPAWPLQAPSCPSHGPAGLAVRSSCACEDMERASFAGIYESYLGITDMAGYWQSVRRCWCSAWSPQAVAYARRMGLELAADGMAVLVQPVVPADAAGVTFTADPASGNPWRFVVNATFGLAARLLDGAAPADQWVLTWDSGTALERQVAAKPTALVANGGAVVAVPLPGERRQAAALSDEQVQAVWRLALAVDRAFGRRMDLEWAVAGSDLYLLQARPLTALPPFFPHDLSPEDAAETWQPRRNPYAPYDDTQEGPVAPIGAHRIAMDPWHVGLTDDDIFPRRLTRERLINGYCYATPSNWMGSPSGYDLPGEERWLDANEARLRRDWLRDLAAMHQGCARLDEETGRERSAVGWVRLFLWFEGAEADIWFGAQPAQWLALALDGYLKAFVAEVMPDCGIEGLPGVLLQGLSCYSLERTAAAQDLGRGVEEPFVAAAFRDRPLADVVPSLEAEHPGCRFLRECAAFCDRFGLESLRVTGGDRGQTFNAEGLLLTIKLSLPGSPRQAESVRDVLARAGARRVAAAEQARQYLRRQRPDQLQRFDKLLDWAHLWVPALDDRKYHAAMTVRLVRLMYRTGQALAAEGLVDHAADVTLLPIDVLRAYAADGDAAALHGRYERCRLQYEGNCRLQPPAYLGKAPEEQAGAGAAVPGGAQAAAPAPSTAGGTVYRGQPIAPGRVRGVARKVASLDAADYADTLTGSEVLICPRDEPEAQWRRDWYSLFLVVRALVTVQGAQLHHATQISRECGVPYVNLPDADFAALPDGVEVEVDGAAGTLTVV